LTTFKLNYQDRLGQALIKSALILIVGLTISVVVWFIKESAVADEASFQHQMNYLRSEVARIRQDRAWTKTYQSNYEKMVANGLIGDESRLEWRALIVGLAQRLKLPDIKMTFSPKKSQPGVARDHIDQNVPLQVSSYESKMALDLTLFHALDLLPILDELDSSTTAILMPLRCRMSLDKDPIFLDARPLIESHCDLKWVTVQPTPPATVDENY